MRYWLDYSVADNTFIDVIRSIVIFLSVIVIVYAAITARYCWTHGLRWIARWWLSLSVGFLALCQNWQQYGRPMLVWRLPVLIAGVVGGIIVIRTTSSE